MNPNEIDCPECGETLEPSDYQIEIDCPECQNHWLIDHDAEFIDGHWRDLTKLIKP